MRAARRTRIVAGLAALALSGGLLVGCGDDDGEVGIPNPASVYCEEQGGEVVIVVDDEGNESGLCRLPDGTEIDEWEYYRQRETTEPTEPAVTSTVEVYLLVDGDECDETRAVVRSVEGDATIEAALTELLAGPTPDEEAEGLGGWFSSETAGMLQSVEVVGGVVDVSFDAALRTTIPNASSSCGSAGLFAQLDRTIGQFDDVDRIFYALDGDVDAFYEWLQFGAPER
jgi:putative hemolysin